jgi:hypothetical protein
MAILCWAAKNSLRGTGAHNNLYMIHSSINNQFQCSFLKVKKNIPNGNAGYVVIPAVINNTSGVSSRAGTAVSLARLGAGSASHQQGGSATRRIVVESYRAMPPERKDEFEIYAQNILRHSRLGSKTRPNRPSSRVIHSQDWQS